MPESTLKQRTYDTKNPPESATLVQPQQTNLQRTPPSTPQAEYRRFNYPEWDAAETLFEHYPGASFRSRLIRFRECRTKAWEYKVNATNEVIEKSNSCNQRFCPVCAAAKQKYIARNCQDWLGYCRQPKMLTLTLQHSNAPLKEQINMLYESFIKLRGSELYFSQMVLREQRYVNSEFLY